MAGGNYQAYVDSRLISPPIVTVPATIRIRAYVSGTGIRLVVATTRRWKSCRRVQILGRPFLQTMATWVISIMSARAGAYGTRPSLDLGPYAGQSVRIAFHFTSDYGSAVAPNAGWFVDDVALVTGTPVFNNPEGFELGLADWAVDKGTWQVGVPTSGPGAAYTGTNCAATVLAGNYQANMDTRLISPSLTLPTAGTSPALRFNGWFRFASGDQGVVEIKAASANSWTPLYTNSGISSGWTYPFIDLSSYGGETVQIAFHAISDSGSVDAGWYIDNVTISGYTAPPSITQPPTNQTVGVESPVTSVVVASGVGQLTYQWQFNDTPISGAQFKLFHSERELTNAGNYSVIVSNSGGASLSPEALLTITPAPGVDK